MKFLYFAILWLCCLEMPHPLLANALPPFTLCTWNIEHLAAHNDAGCRPRRNPDYHALQMFAADLKADIIAFQEVENQTAARRVFKASEYHIEISGRPDIELGRCWEGRQSRRMQRTGFAIRKDLKAKHGIIYRRRPDVQSLATGPSERWGVHIELLSSASPGTTVHLVCVHLKSGCSYSDPEYCGDDSPCSRLAEQVPRLEAWMDARAAAGEEFIVIGDMNRQLDVLGDPVWEAWDDSECCTWEQPDTGLWRCRQGTRRFNPIADIERARSGRKHPYPHNPKHPFAIDHIIMSAGADRMAIEVSAQFIHDRQRLSDHTPLVMKIQWE